MKMKILSILLFSYLSLFSQKPSLSDTKNWIKEKTESYGYESVSTITSYVNGYYSDKKHKTKHNYMLNISDNGELLITHNIFSSGMPDRYTLYIIPIKYLKSIKYETEDDRIYVAINLHQVGGVTNKIKVYESKDGKITPTPTETLSGFSLMFRKSFEEDNMPERYKKAFDNLITFYGGKVFKEVY